VTRSWNSRHAAQGFRQIHDEQNLRLQQWVRGYANTPRVLDLYGGIGNLSLGLGDSVVNVDVVDVTPVRGSIDPRVRFHRSPVLPWLLKNRDSKGIGPMTVITDPQDVKKMGAVQWLAVGCDPDSWARDLSKLVKHGWRVQDVAIFDFFPQTPHVECAAFLQLS
jgi:23S rRNA (uracil1939-C5)-methyltransferase